MVKKKRETQGSEESEALSPVIPIGQMSFKHDVLGVSNYGVGALATETTPTADTTAAEPATERKSVKR